MIKKLSQREIFVTNTISIRHKPGVKGIYLMLPERQNNTPTLKITGQRRIRKKIWTNRKSNKQLVYT